MKFLTVIVFLTWTSTKGAAQHLWNNNKEEQIYHSYILPNSKGISEEQQALEKSTSGNAYNFMNLRKTIDAFNAMITSTGDNYWINQQRRLIDNIVQSAQISSDIVGNLKFKDEFKGWISRREGFSYQKENPLFESYSFLYITQFLYITRGSKWVVQTNDNQIWWNSILNFIEQNIWTKWYDRSNLTYNNPYRYFLRSRTHMGSHWAGIAMYLNTLTTNSQIRAQTAELIQQYDTLLKRNLRLTNGGYLWNSTYDNIEGTFAGKSEDSIIQDIEHGNHVVSYIINAYIFGNKNWLPEDIKRLIVTLKERIYNPNNNTFHDNVDGSDNINRPGWGNYISDGWLKLAAYDKETNQIFQKFGTSKLIKKYNQELQFNANMFKINQGDSNITK